MKQKKENAADILISVNKNLCDDMYVQELEKRLETDPLMTNGLLNFVTDTSDLVRSEGDWCLFCNIESDNED